MNTLIPTYKCFYKMTNKDGWLINLGDNIRGDIEEQYKNAKIEGKILDYKFFEDGKRNPKFDRDYKIEHTSYWMSLRDCWGFSPETETWYDEDELLPEPKCETEFTSDFQISYEIEDEDGLVEYVSNLKNENLDDLCLPVKIGFKTKSQEDLIILEYHLMINELRQFLIDIENGKSVRLYIREYSEDSLHIWQRENNTLRFVIQNSLDNGLKFALDVTIPREIFLNQFKEVVNAIDTIIHEYKEKY